MVTFRKATKEQAKLRAAVFGPSGSGKTYTSLRIATGLGGSIAYIDTERGSASKYADRFDFDVLDLEDRSVRGYVEAIQAAAQAGYQVLIIDSLSHGWQQLLEEVERIAKARYKGNTWGAWSEGTPMQRQLVDAILTFPGHVLATMRSKTTWETQDINGRKQPVRIGLAPEGGKGIEYEFDILLELTTEHVASILKDRTGRWQDKLVDRPDEQFGRDLAAWLAEGLPPREPAPAPAPAQVVSATDGKITVEQRRALAMAAKEAGHDGATVGAWLSREFGVGSSADIPAELFETVFAAISAKQPLGEEAA